MPLSAVTSPPRSIWNRFRHASFPPGPKAVLIALFALLLLICIAGVFYVKYWPFSRKAVLEDLRKATDSTVTAQSYHPTYFPPGCVLYGLEFHHGPKNFKLIEIQKLRVRGSYLGMLRRHVSRIVADGAHVFIPPFGTREFFHTQHSKTVVDVLVANGSFVEFEPKQARERPFRFDVHEATFRGVRWDRSISYHLKFHNQNPPSEISANGEFGPWSQNGPDQTPFSGRYTFDHADLGVYGGINGILSSQGDFGGTLKQLTVEGNTETPDFRVKGSGNSFNLTTKFKAYVNGQNGDTILKDVEAKFGHTVLLVQGSIAKTDAHNGKFTEVHFSSDHARIEDVLGLFTSGRAPMSGETTLRVAAELPPGNEPFVRKVRLEGSFDISHGSFSKPKTQHGVNELSAGARGEDKNAPQEVMTDLRGQVKLEDGIAHFLRVSFAIPGAIARMHGTYGMTEPYRIDLHGQMRVDTRISKTTSGVKSLLLKVLDPIFKKRKRGEIVPIHILGTYNKPDFGLDLQRAKK